MKTCNKSFQEVTTARGPASHCASKLSPGPLTVSILHPHLFCHPLPIPSCWSPCLDVGTTTVKRQGLLLIHRNALSTSVVAMELAVRPWLTSSRRQISARLWLGVAMLLSSQQYIISR